MSPCGVCPDVQRHSGRNDSRPCQVVGIFLVRACSTPSSRRQENSRTTPVNFRVAGSSRHEHRRGFQASFELFVPEGPAASEIPRDEHSVRKCPRVMKNDSVKEFPFLAGDTLETD